MGKKRIMYLAVTNSLTYDQRMSRICTTLHESGYDVHLIGIKRNESLPERPYHQYRLVSLFRSGKGFYLENHIRLFFFLIFRKADLLVANDLDTALPIWLVSKLRGIPRVMDAHEYFTEMKEVLSRPRVNRIWSALANFLIPRYPKGYTVGQELIEKFKLNYGVTYALIRNVPVRDPNFNPKEDAEPFILYQGAVNQGRGFETLIPAMRMIPYKLVICGDGNYMEQLKRSIEEENVTDRVQLTGMIAPSELRNWARRAWVGISLPDPEGANQYLALTNKFFNNVEAGLPQITCRYPEYERINLDFPVAILLNKVDPQTVAESILNLMKDSAKRADMREACRLAREKYCWQEEQSSLINFYQSVWQG